MGFSRQEYWSRLPFPPPGALPDPGIKLMSLESPSLAGFFATNITWEAHFSVTMVNHGFLVAQRLKRLPAVQETWVRFLSQEDPLEKEMATHSSILAWRIPWMEEPGRLHPRGRKEQDRIERLHFKVTQNSLNYSEHHIPFWWFAGGSRIL